MTQIISVLNMHVKMGSPSSQALTLRAYSVISSDLNQGIVTSGLTTKSSCRLVMAMERIVTSGILRSSVVVTRPSFAAEMTKWTALFDYSV